jgi:hypothetical protein
VLESRRETAVFRGKKTPTPYLIYQAASMFELNGKKRVAAKAADDDVRKSPPSEGVSSHTRDMHPVI